MIYKKLLSLTTIIFFFLTTVNLAIPVYAQGSNLPPCSNPPVEHPVDINCYFGFGNISSLGQGISLLTGPAFAIATAGVVIYFVIGSVRFLLSGGDKNALEGAHKMIVHAVIGFIILIFAYLILQLIPQIFGLKIYLL